MSTTGQTLTLNTFGGARNMNITPITGLSGAEVCANDTLRVEAMFSNGDCGQCGNVIFEIVIVHVHTPYTLY